MRSTGLTGSPASALLTKMRKADLLERLNGADYGKYRFKAIIDHEGYQSTIDKLSGNIQSGIENIQNRLNDLEEKMSDKPEKNQK